MNAFEINKIIGAILVTVLTMLVLNFLANILMPPLGGEHGAPAADHAAPSGEAGPAASAEAVAPIATRLAQASAEKGAAVAKKCNSCHTLDKGGANKVGPNLWGVIGRDKGSVDDYRYSTGMAEAGGAWSYGDLDAFLADPKAAVAKTKMTFKLDNPGDRADVIAYLRTQSDSPLPLPEAAADSGTAPQVAAPAAAGSEAKEEVPAASLVALLQAASAERGLVVAKKCKTCHSLDEGGPNKVGPALWGVVGRPKGKHEGYRYSDGLASAGGDWTYEDLNTFLSDPKATVPGTKMTFKLVKEIDRADLIAYLRTLSASPPPLPGR